MTTLFNLDSYPAFCSDCELFRYSSNSPSTYKSSLEKQIKQPYWWDNSAPPYLTISSHLYYPKLHESALYIISDKTDLLSLRSLLKPGENYLYKSAYYYWNYRSQIQAQLDLSKPIIFLDFNSLSNQNLCPITLNHLPEYSYPIPILDHRQGLQFSQQYSDLYDQFYQNLTSYLVKTYFPSLTDTPETLKHLSGYLKKIRVLQNLTNPLTIEILSKGQIYYKSVSINTNTIYKLLTKLLNLNSIQALTANKNYSFILVGDYNYLPEFRANLANLNLLVPEPNDEFNHIWQQRGERNFPLFGQYLDQIEFKIQTNFQPEWIELLSIEEQENIYYEGVAETQSFIGKIRATQKSDFLISPQGGVLPIKINGEEYIINNAPQAYHISYPLQAGGEAIRVQLEFLIKPGSTPSLRVKDLEDKYTIKAVLEPYEPIEQSYAYIPWSDIQAKRQEYHNHPLNPERVQKLIIALNQLKQHPHSDLNGLNKIKSIIEEVYDQVNSRKMNNNIDLLLGTNPDYPELNQVINHDTLGKLSKVLISYFTKSLLTQNEKTLEPIITKMFMLIGKTYRFSGKLALEEFFNYRLDSPNLKITKGEYFHFLSRVAVTRERQLKYLDYFFQSYDGQKYCYQVDSYLWGYGRILLWYSNFDYTCSSELDQITKHFSTIVTYLTYHYYRLQGPNSKGYRQNAFLSLIYLLTFREKNPQFISKDSLEYTSALKLIELYQNQPVYLRITKDKSLNQYLEELLQGTGQSILPLLSDS